MEAKENDVQSSPHRKEPKKNFPGRNLETNLVEWNPMRMKKITVSARDELQKKSQRNIGGEEGRLQGKPF